MNALNQAGSIIWNFTMNRNLIKCNAIAYRKGFIEVRGDIHKGCVNLEVWNIHPEVDITDIDLGSDLMPEGAVTGNTEIELPIEKAELLVQWLTEAIKVAREKL